MIIFLNFAPIDFMGGAEKLMLELANNAQKKEEVILIDVKAEIANIYGKLLLNRTFDSHIQDHDIKKNVKHYSLSYKHFIPFTTEWLLIRNIFKKSRIIYIRFEILELFIDLYFGGISSMKKTVAGLQLTPFYTSPRGLVDKLHNLVYGSFVYKYFLQSSRMVHVLNNRDKKLLRDYYKVKNIVLLPVGIDFKKLKKEKYIGNKNELNIMYVGELSTRKGVDTVCEVIANSPRHFKFHIVGDGPLKERLVVLDRAKLCTYHKYVTSDSLHKLFSQSDVLLFPSRSEAFGIVMAEAMRFGVKIVNSSEVTLELPKTIETTIDNRNFLIYIKALDKIFLEKKADKINRDKIEEYALNTYSDEKINNDFNNKILGI